MYNTYVSKPLSAQEFWSGLEITQGSERTDL